MNTNAEKKKLIGLGFGDNIQSLIKSQKEIDLEKLHSDVQYLKATLQTYGLSIKRDPIDELQKINKWEVDLSEATDDAEDSLVPVISVSRLHPIINNYVYELFKIGYAPNQSGKKNLTVDTGEYYVIIKKSIDVSTMESKYNYINGLYSKIFSGNVATYDGNISVDTELSEGEILVKVSYDKIGFSVNTSYNSYKLYELPSSNELNQYATYWFPSNLLENYICSFKPSSFSKMITNAGAAIFGYTSTPTKRGISFEIIKSGDNSLDYIDGLIITPLSSTILPLIYYKPGSSYTFAQWRTNTDKIKLKLYNKKISDPLHIVSDEISAKKSNTGDTIKHEINAGYLSYNGTIFNAYYEDNESYYIPVDNPTPIRIV